MKLSILYRTYILKLWYPQILQGINDYNTIHGSEATSVCNVIESLGSKNISTSVDCTVVSIINIKKNISTNVNGGNLGVGIL